MSPEPTREEPKPTHKPAITPTKETGTTKPSPNPNSALKTSPNKRSRENDGDVFSTPKVDREPKRRAVSHRAPEVIEVEGEDEVREFDPRSDVLIDLEAFEFKLEEELFVGKSPRRNRQPIVPRNQPLGFPWVKVDTFKWSDTLLRVGKTVELVNGSFLQITSVFRNSEIGSIRLRGLQLGRSRTVEGMLPKKLNELCYIYEVDLDDPRSAEEQSTLEYELDDVLKIRRFVISWLCQHSMLLVI